MNPDSQFRQIVVPLISVAVGGLALFWLYVELFVSGAPRVQLTVVAGVLIAIAALVAVWTAHQTSASLEEAASAAARVAAGKSGHRFPSGLGKELDTIATAFNQLVRQVEAKDGQAPLERSQEAVLSSMTEAVIATDVKGRLIALNPAAARLFHMQGVDYVGRKLGEVVRNPDLQRLFRQLKKAEEAVEAEISLPGTGGMRHMRVSGTRLTEGKKRVGSVAVLTDVTRIRQLESMRRDFVANVSHELKTPITAIRGAVETLVEGAADKPKDRAKFLDILHRQSDRLAALVADTLSLAQIEKEVEAGEVSMRKRKLAPLLAAAVADCEPRAVEKKVKISITCDEELSARIDAGLMEQALVNLLTNAIAYSPDGKSIKVSAVQKKDEIVLSVADKGTGIPASHHDRLFERFYRVDAARSRRLGGTGLGLAIVKHVAMAHGGRVSLSSTVGKGSTFRIHLPAPS